MVFCTDWQMRAGESDEELQQDKRRWEAADVDHDAALDRTEYANFIHPENAEHMRKVYIKVQLVSVNCFVG